MASFRFGQHASSDASMFLRGNSGNGLTHCYRPAQARGSPFGTRRVTRPCSPPPARACNTRPACNASRPGGLSCSSCRRTTGRPETEPPRGSRHPGQSITCVDTGPARGPRHEYRATGADGVWPAGGRKVHTGCGESLIVIARQRAPRSRRWRPWLPSTGTTGIARAAHEAGWTGSNWRGAVNRLGAEVGAKLRYDRAAVSHWLAGFGLVRPVPA